ncbi:TIGR04283 family arsenosugar biosynthesis glycosyltransferase [Desulfospira joergensenii]|uniref:TIGR04283 family arsenosugar biosynthesis glycosyltransferase n=1 Tax=Desulfospira joergensenii TaxID=53329 RepID=UPI0003B658CA|nr:TIGR04283 family arsenosugar biosynthesis glycosyltransferase [Desulfospira joergensenii]
MDLSIIIPVYRENKVICGTIARIRELDLPCRFEIILCDGESRASTLAHVRRNLPGSRDLVLVESGKGRGIQMNAGAARARGDLLFFLHADTFPDRTGMEAMLQSFWQKSRPSTFCGAFDLHINSRKKIFRIIEKTASTRSRLTRIPYGDQGIFISGPFFERLGGFPREPIMEDVGLMKKIRTRGVRPVFLDHAVSTSARRWEKQGIVYTTLRNWVLICLYSLGVSPKRLVRYY